MREKSRGRDKRVLELRGESAESRERFREREGEVIYIDIYIYI